MPEASCAKEGVSLLFFAGYPFVGRLLVSSFSVFHFSLLGGGWVGAGGCRGTFFLGVGLKGNFRGQANLMYAGVLCYSKMGAMAMTT